MGQKMKFNEMLNKNKSALRKSVASFAAVSLLTVGVISTHSAFFIEKETMATMTTGFLDVSVENGSTAQLLDLDFGDKVRPQMTPVSQPITIRNTGTVPIKYTIKPTDVSKPLPVAASRIYLKIDTTSGSLERFSFGTDTTPRTLAPGATVNLTATLYWTNTSALANEVNYQDTTADFDLMFRAWQG